MPTLGDLAKPPDLPQEQLEREACGIVQSQNSSTSRTVRVALSGFGPFRNIAVNPSWQCLIPLQGLCLDSPGGRNISLKCTEIPVTYRQVEQYCHEHHGNIAGFGDERYHYDIHLHVGVSASRSHISLERRARRYGYSVADVMHEEPPSACNTISGASLAGFIGEEWGLPEVHEEFCSILDVDRVVQELSKMWPGQVQVSEDAGLYLCEYLYYCSLATGQRVSAASQQPAKPVMFMHIPLARDDKQMAEFTRIVQDLVCCIVDTMA